jgi:hypothetical protein
MANAVRLLLIFTLLLCSRGMSVCLDGEGLGYFCAPELLADENGESPDDGCPCPCDEDDCEEQEVASDLLVTKSVQLPADTCTLLSANHVADGILATVCPIRDWQPCPGLSASSPDPGLLTRGPLLSSVVLRL